MATTNNFKRLLHRKAWGTCANALVSNNSANGPCCVSDRTHKQWVYWLRGSTSLYHYDPYEDAWGTMTSPALNTFGAGACMEHSAKGPSGTATAGSSTTLTTNLTIPVSLAGYTIRLTGGTSAGDVRTITSNTLGANSVITVGSAFTGTPDGTTTYDLLTGTLYMLCGSTISGAAFRKWDHALQTYTTLSISGLPGSFGTDGLLIGTPSIIRNGTVTAQATGTATSGASTTLTNSGKSWATNQWANAFQVRITGGTGAGQTRIIASNTGTVLTVSSAWTTNPDATSTYSIEGNDDYLYLMGNGAVTMYRYSISGNSWSTLSPGVARSVAPGLGMTGTWIGDSTDSTFTTENSIVNGKRIYCFNGGGVATLCYYDIAANSWTNGVTHGPLTIFPTTGWKHIDYKGKVYIRDVCTATSNNSWYVFDPAASTVLPWNTQSLFATTNLVGRSNWISTFDDGATTIPFLYSFVEQTGNTLIRCMIQ